MKKKMVRTSFLSSSIRFKSVKEKFVDREKQRDQLAFVCVLFRVSADMMMLAKEKLERQTGSYILC